MNAGPSVDPVEPIVLVAETTAAPAIAWRTITEPADLARWFAQVTPVDGIGSPYRIDFGDGSLIEGTVRDVAPGHRLAYTWRWKDEEPPQTTLVTWTVEPTAPGGSLVRLRHDGWTEAGADAATRDEHAGYWEDYLAELTELLDEEAGGS
ncbi:MAG TPA: SRPBCC domain-containing protein [Candidatus Saccharimonadales bacterium]|nr:SRPBCC domain-containing protein [Candidatus Saccharimonadales bacterium]